MITWRLRIVVLWISMSVCQSAGVALLLFEPGAVRDLMGGHLLGEDVHSPATQIATALFWLGPMAMAFLTLVLAEANNRQVNALLGGGSALYGVANLVGTWGATSAGAHLVGVAQVLVPVLILWHAWKWPRPGEPTRPRHGQGTTLR